MPLDTLGPHSSPANRLAVQNQQDAIRVRVDLFYQRHAETQSTLKQIPLLWAVLTELEPQFSALCDMVRRIDGERVGGHFWKCPRCRHMRSFPRFDLEGKGFDLPVVDIRRSYSVEYLIQTRSYGKGQRCDQHPIEIWTRFEFDNVDMPHCIRAHFLCDRDGRTQPVNAHDTIDLAGHCYVLAGVIVFDGNDHFFGYFYDHRGVSFHYNNMYNDGLVCPLRTVTDDRFDGLARFMPINTWRMINTLIYRRRG
jgi:hypothetical protein